MIVRHNNGLVTFEIADDSPLAIAITKREIVAEAAAAHEQFPQYVGHWDGAEWRVARITRRIKTKLGVAFEEGDITIAHEADGAHRALGINGHTAYSRRNGIDTSVPVDALEWMEVVT